MGGPGTWYKTEDAFNLKEWYGQCRSLGSLHIISQAAQLRTLHTHNTTRKSNRTLSSVSAIDMHGNLQRLLHDPIDPFRAHRWREWYAGAHVSVLARNESNMARKKLSLRGCLIAIAGGEPEPWSDDVIAKQKRSLQKFATSEIKKALPQNGENHIRDHLARWMDPETPGPRQWVSHNFLIPGPPLWVARKVNANFQRLSKLVPPRVCSAVWRCIFNGWCTARRFQQRHEPWNMCCMGCSMEAEDSIEHYCRCSITHDVFRTKLRIELNPKRALATFCMSTFEQNRDDILSLTMLGVYAIYMTTNHYRKVGRTNPTVGKNYMVQNIIQGCQGHRNLTSLVQGRWQSEMFYFR